jgi:hypothetical protein
MYNFRPLNPKKLTCKKVASFWRKKTKTRRARTAKWRLGHSLHDVKRTFVYKPRKALLPMEPLTADLTAIIGCKSDGGTIVISGQCSKMAILIRIEI